MSHVDIQIAELQQLKELAEKHGYMLVPMTSEKITTTEYFGGCPECGNNDGYINIGLGHWFFCKTHRTTWFGGSNLFSSCQDESEEDQRRIYDEIGFDHYRKVEAVYADNDDNAGVPPRHLSDPPAPYRNGDGLHQLDDDIPF